MIVERVVTHLESDLTTTNTHRRSANVREMLDRWTEGSPEAELPPEAQWEVCALDLMAVRTDPRAQRTERRFGPLIEFHGGDAYPDVAALMEDDQALAYYRRRAEQTTNPIQRARYADILWEALRLRGADDAFRFGEMAVRSYVELAQVCVEQGVTDNASGPLRGIELADALSRAAELARQLNNEELGAVVVQAILEALRKLPAEERYRWVIDLGFALVSYADSRFAQLVPVEALEEVRGICEEGVRHHDDQEQRNLNILDDLMQLCSGLSKAVGDDSESWRWQVEMARSWEREARYRETGEGPARRSLVAFKYAEGALRKYQHLVSLAPTDAEGTQMRQKVSELKVEVRRLAKQAEAEMREVSVSADIESERLEQMVQPFLASDMCGVFELLPSLLPNVDQLREAATEAAERHVFSSLLPRISLRSGRKVDEVAAFQGEVIQFQQQLDVWFQVHAQFLDYVLWRLEEAGIFTEDSYLACLREWPLLEERDLPFVEMGLERYFAEDYISAIHVLAPRIESMLKAVFERAGTPLVVLPDARRIREQGLGDFLVREEVRTALGEPMWQYMHYALVDERGRNLRNDIAHGWIDAGNCNRVTAKILLFIIALVTLLQIGNGPDQADDVHKLKEVPGD